MPALRELDARFQRHAVEPAPKGHGRKLPDGSIQWGGFPIDVFYKVRTLAEADGISFLCPKSFAKNSGPKGTHRVQIFFEGRNAPDHIGRDSGGHRVRWSIAGGTGLDDLQLSPSIQEIDDGLCSWHGFVGSSGVPPGHAA